MRFSPGLDAPDMIGSGEVVFVCCLTEPSFLTGGFAGFFAVRLGTILLVISVFGLRGEQVIAVFAFAFTITSDHRPIPPGRIMNAHKASWKKKLSGKKI
jgi:hypothetical protein